MALRNGAAVLLLHGSAGSRARTVAHAQMLAGRGYGVLALDLPGNGRSTGHSSGLGEARMRSRRCGARAFTQIVSRANAGAPSERPSRTAVTPTRGSEV